MRCALRTKLAATGSFLSSGTGASVVTLRDTAGLIIAERYKATSL